MSNLKTTQLATVKVTVGSSQVRYEIICKSDDKDALLFKRAKSRARCDFGDLLDTEKISYQVISRKTLNT